MFHLLEVDAVIRVYYLVKKLESNYITLTVDNLCDADIDTVMTHSQSYT